MIAFFLILWGYFIWFEIAWNGQTPGKRQMGLRVVRDGGYPVTPYAVITRNFLRVIDVMPLFTPILLLLVTHAISAALARTVQASPFALTAGSHIRAPRK